MLRNEASSSPFSPRLVFLVGPTAVGKTELALQWAEQLGADILSCDSLCVYRGMDIGTAKPSAEEQARVPHYGIDLNASWEPCSVEQYARYAETVVDQARRQNRHLLVTGGSGFYLKAFFSAIVDKLHIPSEIEAFVADLQAAEGLPGMVRELQKLNPNGTGTLDVQNPRRVEKALLRCLASGLTVVELRERFEALPEPFADCEKHVVLLQRDAEELRQRVRLRVQQMLDQGLVDEVRRLIDEGFERNPSAAGSIGYRETIHYLRHGGTLDALAEEISIHTDQLIRKQRTWFKKQIPVHEVWDRTGT
ncbi:MAG: tRNA (adenosine(37)-N6)-dimethylallyltransferase MiaA [Verrucomicrobiota bacterium JB022]|nr:tRNA (adenosine(37)-N6)-dimethylallyltransferase MiaA [Verrucomicrobiota bacterium JB022]